MPQGKTTGYEPRQIVQKADLGAAEATIYAELHALRQHVEDLDRLYTERDRMYSERDASAKLAVKDALAANDKAITKAEMAQSEYNARSNEFRGQLDDQAKTLMPRNEFASVIANINSKIDRNSEDIRFLREGGGAVIKDGATKGVKDETRANIAILVSIIGVAMSFVVMGVLLWRAFSGN